MCSVFTWGSSVANATGDHYTCWLYSNANNTDIVMSNLATAFGYVTGLKDCTPDVPPVVDPVDVRKLSIKTVVCDF